VSTQTEAVEIPNWATKAMENHWDNEGTSVGLALAVWRESKDRQRPISAETAQLWAIMFNRKKLLGV